VVSDYDTPKDYTTPQPTESNRSQKEGTWSTQRVMGLVGRAAWHGMVIY